MGRRGCESKNTEATTVTGTMGMHLAAYATRDAQVP